MRRPSGRRSRSVAERGETNPLLPVGGTRTVEQRRVPDGQPAVVTCGLPYANGDLHVGHLRTYVDGDAQSRAATTRPADGLRRGRTCTAPPSPSTPPKRASHRGSSHSLPRNYAETFPQFNIEFDNYGHTDDETNVELTQEFVRSWVENDHVDEKEIRSPGTPRRTSPSPTATSKGPVPTAARTPAATSATRAAAATSNPAKSKPRPRRSPATPRSTASASTSSSPSPTSKTTCRSSSTASKAPRTPGTSPASGSRANCKTGVSPATWTGASTTRRR